MGESGSRTSASLAVCLLAKHTGFARHFASAACWPWGLDAARNVVKRVRAQAQQDLHRPAAARLAGGVEWVRARTAVRRWGSPSRRAHSIREPEFASARASRVSVRGDAPGTEGAPVLAGARVAARAETARETRAPLGCADVRQGCRPVSRRVTCAVAGTQRRMLES